LSESFISDLFGTRHNIANRAAAAAVPPSELDPIGTALRRERRDVDKVTTGLHTHT
jgi:hypothetical protein